MRLTSGLLARWHPMSVRYSNLPDRYIKRAMEQASISKRQHFSIKRFCTFNFFWRIYIRKSLTHNPHVRYQVYWKTPNRPNYLPRTVERKKFFFNTHRPWTRPFYYHNAPGVMRKTVHVEPIKDWSFFRGDKVSNFFQLVFWKKKKWYFLRETSIVRRTPNFWSHFTKKSA